MTSITLTLTGASAVAEVEGLIVEGMVGMPVTICGDENWTGLVKTLVCRGGMGTRTVANVDGQTAVPPEVLRRSPWGRNELFLGVEGRNSDGTLVMVSTMAFCGEVLPGADPAPDLTTEISQPLWAQLLQMIGPLGDLQTDRRDNLVSAINQVLARIGEDEDEDHSCTCEGAGVTDITITEV